MLLFAIRKILIYSLLLPGPHRIQNKTSTFSPFLPVSEGKDHDLLSFLILYHKDDGSIVEVEENINTVPEFSDDEWSHRMLILKYTTKHLNCQNLYSTNNAT